MFLVKVGIAVGSFTAGDFLNRYEPLPGKTFQSDLKAQNIRSAAGLQSVKGNKNFPLCGLNDGKNALNISETSPNRFSYSN